MAAKLLSCFGKYLYFMALIFFFYYMEILKGYLETKLGCWLHYAQLRKDAMEMVSFQPHNGQSGLRPVKFIALPNN